MSSVFDKLNLRPQERRLVVIVGIVVFIVLNVWLVIPMFGEYGKYERRIVDATANLRKYQDEIGRRSRYEKELRELESQGPLVPTEEAGLRLSQEVNSQAALSGVTINSITPLQRQGSGGKTNAFFEEAAVTINIKSGEKELIDFLFRLADKDMLIRAKSMQLGTDPARMSLQGQITLVKSFQRRPTTKGSTVAAASPKAAALPAATAPKTNLPTPKTNALTKPATTVPASTSAPPTSTPKPTLFPAPTRSPGPAAPAPTPAPKPSGGTNSIRRLPTPFKPESPAK